MAVFGLGGIVFALINSRPTIGLAGAIFLIGALVLGDALIVAYAPSQSVPLPQFQRRLAARERGPEEREALLAQATAEMRGKVEALLAQDASDDKILDRPAAELFGLACGSYGDGSGTHRCWARPGGASHSSVAAALRLNVDERYRHAQIDEMPAHDFHPTRLWHRRYARRVPAAMRCLCASSERDR